MFRSVARYGELRTSFLPSLLPSNTPTLVHTLLPTLLHSCCAQPTCIKYDGASPCEGELQICGYLIHACPAHCCRYQGDLFKLTHMFTCRYILPGVLQRIATAYRVLRPYLLGSGTLCHTVRTKHPWQTWGAFVCNSCRPAGKATAG